MFLFKYFVVTYDLIIILPTYVAEA